MTKGTRPGHFPSPSKPEAEGRVCSDPGCRTKLSVYNTAERCWQHAEVAFSNHRGKRLSAERT